MNSSTREIEVVAPGRICLFGDHQDYLGLPIIACAIDRHITLHAIPATHNYLHLKMPDIGEERKIAIDEPTKILSKRDYFASALNVLSRYQCLPNQGYTINLKGTIPVNAGLSSSSAVLVAWITFLLEAFGADRKVTPEWIAKLAYTSEVLEFNAPGGLMDQYTIALGNTIYLNTITGAAKAIDHELKTLIIAESGVPKETLGVLSQLGNFAKESIKQVQAKHPEFRIEASKIEDFESYEYCVEERLKPVLKAAITNFSITRSAFAALQKSEVDLYEVGALMDAHHFELKTHLGITVPIIDSMINGAKKAGALGAKIVGSGGGGCIVALVEPGKEEAVIKGILEGGAAAAYKINIGKGVQVL